MMVFYFYFRYAFTPLLDAPDDDRDETELFIKETYNGVHFVMYKLNIYVVVIISNSLTDQCITLNVYN